MKQEAGKGLLYLVATPIGNKADLSPRALDILREADVLYAEDTRVTALLLSHFSIRKTLISYHAHNMKSRASEILDRLRDGQTLALVSDAGMPGISDPGSDIAAACIQAGFRLSVIPGPSAAITALAASGLDSRRFVFEGFLPVKGKERRERIAALQGEPRTSLLYEAPHRLLKTLHELSEAGLGGRRICLGRELTKRYEEFLYGTIDQEWAYFQEQSPRGEFVLVMQGRDEALRAAQGDSAQSFQGGEADADAEAAKEYAISRLSAGEAVKSIAIGLAENFAWPKKQAYALVQKLKDEMVADEAIKAREITES